MLSGVALTKREHTVVTLVCGGLSNKMIAKELGLTEGTVKVHLVHIFRKTGVCSRGALLHLYNAGGLVQGSQLNDQARPFPI